MRELIWEVSAEDNKRRLDEFVSISLAWDDYLEIAEEKIVERKAELEKIRKKLSVWKNVFSKSKDILANYYGEEAADMEMRIALAEKEIAALELYNEIKEANKEKRAQMAGKQEVLTKLEPLAIDKFQEAIGWLKGAEPESLGEEGGRIEKINDKLAPNEWLEKIIRAADELDNKADNIGNVDEYNFELHLQQIEELRESITDLLKKHGKGTPSVRVPLQQVSIRLEELEEKVLKLKEKANIAQTTLASPILVSNSVVFEPGHVIHYSRKTGGHSGTNDPSPAKKEYTLLRRNGNEIYIKFNDQYDCWIDKSSILDQTEWVNWPGGAKLFGDNETPTLEDIRQTDVGDCFLLAALGTVVSKHSGYIEKIMKEDGPNHVAVRLFKVTENGPNNYSFSPKVIKVWKSVPKGERYNSKNGLWVRMLEKAYVAGQFAPDFQRAKSVSPTGDVEHEAFGEVAVLPEIQGGFAYWVYMVLMGAASETNNQIFDPNNNKYIDSKEFTTTGFDGNGNPKFEYYPWSKKDMQHHNAGDYGKMKSYEILKSDKDTPDLVTQATKDKIDKWVAYVHKGHIYRFLEGEFSGGYSGQIHIEDLESLLTSVAVSQDGTQIADPLDRKVGKEILDWAKKEKLFPGKRGSGQYSKIQLEWFEKIKNALISGKLVSLQTKNLVGKLVEGKGSSGGESQSAGLAGGHVYSVLEINEAPSGLKELLIRNPWGSYGQAHTQKFGQLESIMTESQRSGDKGKERMKRVIEKLRNSGSLQSELSTESTTVESDFMDSEWIKLLTGIKKEGASALYNADLGANEEKVRLKTEAELTRMFNEYDHSSMDEEQKLKTKNLLKNEYEESLKQDFREGIKADILENRMSEVRQWYNANGRLDEIRNEWARKKEAALIELAKDQLPPKEFKKLKSDFDNGTGDHDKFQQLLTKIENMKNLELNHLQKEKDTGKFWMPLADLTHRFERVDISS
jgi:hypothetical protein